jgi:hypothetical protein
MNYRAGQLAEDDSTIIYRTGKVSSCGKTNRPRRNFEVFSGCDFIAAITQHIPDRSFQLVRYYGWYSNKIRGQRKKRAVAGASEDSNAVMIIEPLRT